MIGTAGASLGRWARRVEANDADPALLVNQRGAGSVFQAQSAGVTVFEVLSASVRFDVAVLVNAVQLRASSATEIGISVRNTAFTTGSEGTLVVPIKTTAGEATDAQVVNIDGALHYNTADNVLGMRDGVADNPVTVGMAGYVVQAYVPSLYGQGWYHPNQLWNEANEKGRQMVDETICTICGEDIVPNMMVEPYTEQMVMVPNGYLSPANAHRDRRNVHATFAHLHLEKDRQFDELRKRIEVLARQLEEIYAIPDPIRV